MWLTLFALGMGFLESSVVVYLRGLYYPDGFSFPLQVIDRHTAATEIIREAATLLMLIAVPVLSVRGATARFGVFLYLFGLWDIFYYVFLKLLLGWPGSLLTIDILFLIPLTWTGPVLAPMINAATMSVLGVILIHYNHRQKQAILSAYEWGLLLLGVVMTFTAYVMDYSKFIFESYSLPEIISNPLEEGLMNYSTAFIPDSFNWLLHLAGEVYFVLAIISFLLRNKKKPR